MSKIKAKVLRYDAIDVASIFNIESELLESIQSGQLDQVLLLWQSKDNTLVLPAGNKWQQSCALTKDLDSIGWKLCSRKTGGAPVPQTKGVINISYIYAMDEQESYSISDAYTSFCDTLSTFFEYFDIPVKSHETPGSYCDGKYNLNINGQKVVGTAQRVVLKKGGGENSTSPSMYTH